VTGDEVRELREALRMSSVDFAQLVGVNVSTLQRWEAKGEEHTRADPAATRILGALAQVRQSRGAAVAGEELRRAVAVRGGLYGVFRLLELLFSA
jgi:transcriptional regulator with XRE-family HTH domain